MLGYAAYGMIYIIDSETLNIHTLAYTSQSPRHMLTASPDRQAVL